MNTQKVNDISRPNHMLRAQYFQMNSVYSFGQCRNRASPSLHKVLSNCESLDCKNLFNLKICFNTILPILRRKREDIRYQTDYCKVTSIPQSHQLSLSRFGEENQINRSWLQEIFSSIALIKDHSSCQDHLQHPTQKH